MKTFSLAGAVVALSLLLGSSSMASLREEAAGGDGYQTMHTTSNCAGVTRLAAYVDPSPPELPAKGLPCFRSHTVPAPGISYPVVSRHESRVYYLRMFSFGPPIPVVPKSW
jgi:hypothetical protein